MTVFYNSVLEIINNFRPLKWQDSTSVWKVNHLGNKNEQDHSELSAWAHSLSYWFDTEMLKYKSLLCGSPMAAENVISKVEAIWIWPWSRDDKNSCILFSLFGLSAVCFRARDLEVEGSKWHEHPGDKDMRTSTVCPHIDPAGCGITHPSLNGQGKPAHTWELYQCLKASQWNWYSVVMANGDR